VLNGILFTMKRNKLSVAKSYVESVISDKTTNTRQSWIRERVVTYRQIMHENGRLPRKSYDVRLKFTVESNAYSFQSSAVVYVWREAPEYGWNEVYRILGENMQTKASYVDKNVNPDAFDMDIESLRNIAGQIIF
jgi:hypothetical protein